MVRLRSMVGSGLRLDSVHPAALSVVAKEDSRKCATLLWGISTKDITICSDRLLSGLKVGSDTSH